MHLIVFRCGSNPKSISLFCWLVLSCAFWWPGRAEAQNKYDVLARTLQPYTALFNSRSATKAWQADVILKHTSSPDPQLFLGQPTRISLQMPNKLRVETLDPDHKVIVWRNEQRVWVYPKDLADRLIAEAGIPGDPDILPDFHLPLKDQQLALLAAFFQIVRFDAITDRAGNPAWDLDLRIAPEIAPQSKDFLASAVVRQSNYQLEQLNIQGPERNEQLQILSSEFSPALPTELFQPTLEGATEIPPSLLRPILSKLSWIIGMR